MKGQLMPPPAVIDIDVVLERLNGSQAMLANLANFFLEDAPEVLQQLHDGLRANSLTQIFGNAHRLKGLASTFEPTPVAELAAEIESCGRNGDTTQCTELTSQLDSEFARLTEALEAIRAFHA
jgi:HPt (histidine-containing phosphotransfer) domain-containing protein